MSTTQPMAYTSTEAVRLAIDVKFKSPDWKNSPYRKFGYAKGRYSIDYVDENGTHFKSCVSSSDIYEMLHAR